MEVNSASALEPGLLRTFRLFVVVRLVLHGLALLGQFSQHQPRLQRYPLLALLEAGLLLLYLSWPWLRRRLGEAFLPLALLVASAGPILEHALSVARRLRAGEAVVAGDAWQLFPLLFVPLILLSWQYSFRWVLVFCGGTALLDLGLAIPLALLGGPRWATMFALVFVRTLLFALVGYVIVRLMAAQRAQRRELTEANARLLHYARTLEELAVSRERNRLARELHDTLAHSLSALAVQLEAIHTLWQDDPRRAHELLEQSLGLTREGLREARRAIQSLRASPLEDLGLGLALQDLARSAAARAGLQLELQAPDQVDGLGPDLEQAIYQVAREALANVVQHAQAGHLRLCLERVGGRLILTVADDGRGFDPEGVPEGHYGLRGMQERAALVGARLSLQSRPGQGTTVRLVVEDTGDPRTDL
ncbi:MAG: sensor histidine kinase [Chloroflexia bacterium]|nr:sensor histidine kinase [Chloroflexia bacterium]